jgi:hypothetical protein
MTPLHVTSPQSVSYIISALISSNFIIKNYVNRKITSYIYILIFTKSLWSLLFGATCNFNDQILPYGILFLAFINTDVFYLLSFKFSQTKFGGYIGITLAVRPSVRPSMYLVSATPLKRLIGFLWNFTHM